MFGVGGNAPDVTACTGGNSSELLEFAIIGGRKGDGCIVRGLSSSSRKKSKKEKKKRKEKKRKENHRRGWLYRITPKSRAWVGETHGPRNHKKQQ